MYRFMLVTADTEEVVEVYETDSPEHIAKEEAREAAAECERVIGKEVYVGSYTIPV